MRHVDVPAGDAYLGLVGELFTRLRQASYGDVAWMCLGEQIVDVTSLSEEQLRSQGISKAEADLFASAAFFFGGLRAKASLRARDISTEAYPLERYRACRDVLVYPSAPISQFGKLLAKADKQGLRNLTIDLRAQSASALMNCSNEWIATRLLEELVSCLYVHLVTS
jgi:hypothetical protein